MESTNQPQKKYSFLSRKTDWVAPRSASHFPLHFEPEFLWLDSICCKLATKTVRSNKLCNLKLLNLVNSVLRAQRFLLCTVCLQIKSLLFALLGPIIGDQQISARLEPSLHLSWCVCVRVCVFRGRHRPFKFDVFSTVHHSI